MLIYVCLIRIGIYDNVVYVTYTCTPVKAYTIDYWPLKALDNLVAPKDRVTDRVSRIKVWMPNNGLLLKYSRLVYDAKRLGQHLVNERY